MKHYIKGGKKSNTIEYVAWSHMKSRCYNVNNPSYLHYGGRGIIVCNQWLNNFGQFFEDMGPRPDESSLDRKDNNAEYSNSNCRWAKNEIQQNNKRNNKKLSLNNTELNLCQASRAYGINKCVLSQRLKKGWSDKEATETPINETKLHDFNGKSLTLPQWAEETGVKYTTLQQRVYRYNWTLEKSLTTPTRKQDKHAI